MRIEYRTIEGELIERHIDVDRGVTIEDIDYLAMQYFEKTGREPEAVFLDVKAYNDIQKGMAVQMRHSSGGINSGAAVFSISGFQLSMGHVLVHPIRSSYIPVFVGSKAEFVDNDINKIFEETVLKDFDRV